MMNKASKEKADFYNLIGTEVTFKSDIFSVSGMMLHWEGEKAIILDVVYAPERWGNRTGVYIKPNIIYFKIAGRPESGYNPESFTEYNTEQ